MKQSKYFVLFACGLLSFQALDFIFFNLDLSQINSRFIFGLVGTNLVAIATSCLALLILWIVLKRFKNLHLLLVIISAATFSNILDRIFYGGVVDYFSLWFWPSFNVADAVIVVGILTLMYKLIYRTKIV